MDGVYSSSVRARVCFILCFLIAYVLVSTDVVTALNSVRGWVYSGIMS